MPASDPHRTGRWHLGPGWVTRWDLLFGIACLVAVALLLYLSRYLTFYNDEWTFIVDRRQWSFDVFMRPHNEHWALFPLIVYKALFSTVGLRSYLPYLLVLMALHVTAASAVYVLLRRLNGGLPALAAGTLVLFLGTGEDNLFWAFQIGFVGATAAGAWAIVLLVTRTSRRAEVAAAALLTVAVATQGPSLFFLVAVAVMLALDPTRWRRLWVVVPATIAFGAWYVTFGAASITAHRDPFSLAAIQQVPSYVVTGVSYALGRLTGWGEQVGLVLFVVLAVGTAVHVTGRGRLRAAAVAGLAGLIAQYALTGLVRAQLGLHQATSSRYVYVAAVLILIAMAGWIGSRFARPSVRSLAVLLAIVIVALGANVAALRGGRDAYRVRAEATRASIIVIDRYAGSPSVPREAGIYPVPARAELDRIRAELDLTVEDALLPDAPSPHPTVIDFQLYQLVAPAFQISTIDELPSSMAEPTVESTLDVHVTDAADCTEVRVSGPAPQVVMRLAGGTGLVITTEQVGQGQIHLSLNAPADGNFKPVELAPDRVMLVTIPDIGESRQWIVRLVLPASVGATQLCLVDQP